MNNRHLQDTFSQLSTPLIADACVRLGVNFRTAPFGIRPVTVGSRFAGRVLPVRHYGSVDTFLEAMGTAQPGDILVIDNGGRSDEACIGDLVALETQACGLTGMVVWGCHRDTQDLKRIGFPVFSYGMCPVGPLRLDMREPEALTSANFGDFKVTQEDAVFADDDGVVFVSSHHTEEVLTTAQQIWRTERRQAEEIQSGKKLREQLQFDEYLAKRSTHPDYTFRQHLRAIGGAIEE